MELGSDPPIGGKASPDRLVQAATGETVTPWDSDINEKSDDGRAPDTSDLCHVVGDQVG